MAELSDIVTLTTISSTRANLWQSRLIQRYSSVANRTTEHPTPAEGDLSYLEDSNTVWVYNGAAWVNIAQAVGTADITDGAVTVAKLGGPIASAFEVDGLTESASVGTTASLVTIATVNLTIPAGWGSWSCFATATWGALHSTDSVKHEARIAIDGTVQQTLADVGPHIQGASGDGVVPCALVARRTGMTTTGSRAIILQGRHTTTGGTMNDIALYARAVRTT